MRLIWSALWGAFPREIHLISEFLIPSLRALALAPLATPREVEGVEGGRLAQATREGLGWDAPRAPTRRPSPPPPRSPAAFLNCSRSGAWGPRSGPCLQRVGSQASAFPPRVESTGPGNGKTEKEQKGRAGRGCNRGHRKGFTEHFMHSLPRNAFGSSGC